jgi:BirA family biotin operon repressor/biotin-[acetyl-CoA-carboxylase] ligase
MNIASHVEPEPLRRAAVDDWELQEYSVVTSTNLIAAPLPAWHAVRADTQTAGRGRFQRTWISDEGGLWISAVLPTPGGGARWKLLPLAAGAAVCDALRVLGVAGLRMRWPNDVLVGDRKLCGLLLDQFVPDRTVVGIGMNVRNRPEVADRVLEHQVVRLADLVPAVPDLPEITRLILRQLRSMWAAFQGAGLADLAGRVNSLWGGPREVQLELDGQSASREGRSVTQGLQVACGRFVGVDDVGRLILTQSNGVELRFEPHEVRHLEEKHSIK